MDFILVLIIILMGMAIALLNYSVIILEKKLDERTILLGDLIIKHDEEIIKLKLYNNLPAVTDLEASTIVVKDIEVVDLHKVQDKAQERG